MPIVSSKPPLLPVIIGTGFGAGFWPWGPGTAGAVVATALWFGLHTILDFIALQSATVIFIFIFTLLGTWATGRLMPFWGADPSRVVVDEMVGVWIPLVVVRPGEWEYILASLVLFRFFDIVKPLGVRKMESLPGGMGVMADDMLAGIYSLVIILVARWVL